MTTCEICGRPVGFEWGQCPHRMDGTSSRCYQLGYEREKGRADALSAKLAELPSWIKAAYEREPYRGSISDFCTDLAHSLAERLNEPTT